MRKTTPLLTALALTGLAAAAAYALSRPAARKGGRVRAPGRPPEPMTRMLAAGSHLLQGNWPLEEFDVYLVGFHPARDDPHHQMEAHHFCRVVTEDFTECVLFDGNTPDSNLIGIEYIISERLFGRLPEAEKSYWHPHNFEILSGQLQAPGLPAAAEKALMLTKMNSYGKTWHLWDTGNDEHRGDPLPYGDPRLMWSFNRMGEAREWLIRQRDGIMGLDTDARRRDRRDLARFAAPQTGVDLLSGRFSGPSRPLPGVRDQRRARAVTVD